MVVSVVLRRLRRRRSLCFPEVGTHAFAKHGAPSWTFVFVALSIKLREGAGERDPSMCTSLDRVRIFSYCRLWRIEYVYGEISDGSSMSWETWDVGSPLIWVRA